MKTVAIYIHQGLADWEAAHVLPVLRENGFQIQSFSESTDPIQTMGGLTVLPSTALDKMNWQNVQMLILPGGDSWTDPKANTKILSILPKLKKDGVAIAGICAATVAMIRTGFLDKVRHTSNFLKMVKHFVPDYDENRFVETPAVVDQNVITASGNCSLEFSAEILKHLKVYDEKKATEWLEFYKNGTIPETWIP